MSYPPFEHFSEMYGSTPSTPNTQQPQQQQQAHPDPSGAYPQWETIERDMEMHLHGSPHDVDTTPIQTPTSASFHSRSLPQIDLDLEEHPHTISGQGYGLPYSAHPSPVDNAPILLHHPHEVDPQQAQATLLAQAQQQHFEYQQQMSRSASASTTMDPSHLSRTSPSPPRSMLLAPGSSTGAGANPGGPVRSSSTRALRARETRPYNRPSAGSNMATFLGVGASEKSSESSAATSPAASSQIPSGSRTRSKQAVR